MGFPGVSVVKNLAANAGATEDASFILGLRRSPEKEQPPAPVYLPGKSHGQSSLAGYSPWGYKRVRHNLVTKQQENLSF